MGYLGTWLVQMQISLIFLLNKFALIRIAKRRGAKFDYDLQVSIDLNSRSNLEQSKIWNKIVIEKSFASSYTVQEYNKSYAMDTLPSPTRSTASLENDETTLRTAMPWPSRSVMDANFWRAIGARCPFLPTPPTTIIEWDAAECLADQAVSGQMTLIVEVR